MYWTVLNTTAQYSTVLHFTAVHWTLLQCSAVYYNVYTALNCATLQYNILFTLHWTVLHCSVIYCAALHWTLIEDSAWFVRGLTRIDRAAGGFQSSGLRQGQVVICSNKTSYTVALAQLLYSHYICSKKNWLHCGTSSASLLLEEGINITWK